MRDVNPIFAQAADAGATGNGQIAFLMFASGVIGSAGVWLWGRVQEIRQDRRKRAETEEKTLLDHKDELIKRIDCELKECDEEREEHREALSRARIAAARRLQHIRYLERILGGAKLSFEKYEDDSIEEFGSSVHKSLKPKKPKPTEPPKSSEGAP